MKVNFGRELRTLAGESIKGFAGKEKLLLKDVSIEALLSSFDDERGLSGEEKCKRYVLSTRIYGNEELDVTAEEISTIKKLVGKGFSPLIVGQAFQMLENQDKK